MNRISPFALAVSDILADAPDGLTYCQQGRLIEAGLTAAGWSLIPPEPAPLARPRLARALVEAAAMVAAVGVFTSLVGGYA